MGVSHHVSDAPTVTDWLGEARVDTIGLTAIYGIKVL
jgi:hypothetical protein